jgi:hypothetical protein
MFALNVVQILIEGYFFTHALCRVVCLVSTCRPVLACVFCCAVFAGQFGVSFRIALLILI